MKTVTNPRGSGRKAREVPGKQATLVLDKDLFDWLSAQHRAGGVKSDIVNTALRDFKKKFECLSKEPE